MTTKTIKKVKGFNERKFRKMLKDLSRESLVLMLIDFARAIVADRKATR